MNPILTIAFDSIRKVSKHLLASHNYLERYKNTDQVSLDAIKIISEDWIDKEYLLVTNTQELNQAITDQVELICIANVVNSNANYLHHLPFSVDLSFAKWQNYQKNYIIEMSMIYNPSTDRLFHAEKGQGAFINQKRLRINQNKAIRSPMIITEGKKINYKISDFLDQKNILTRNLGSPNLSSTFVAFGQVESCLFNKIPPIEICAGLLLIQEAGGIVEIINEDKFDLSKEQFILAGHAGFCGLLKYNLTNDSLL